MRTEMKTVSPRLILTPTLGYESLEIYFTSWDARLRSGFGTVYGNKIIMVKKSYRDKAWVLRHAVNHVFEIQYCRADITHSTIVTYWFKRILGKMANVARWSVALGVVGLVGFLRLHHEYHHCVFSVFAAVVFVVVSNH